MYEINNRAVELSKNGKLDESIELFNKALKNHPADGNILFNIGLVYMKKEDFKSAVDYFEQSINSSVNDDNLREIGVCYIRLEMYEKAREYLIKAVTEFGSSDSENVLGVLYFKLSKFNEAKRHFENAVKLNDKNRDAWFNLKDTYLELDMERESKMALYKYEQLETE